MKFEAIVIPPELDDRMELVTVDDSDHKAINRLVFGADADGILTGSTFSEHSIQMMFDDEGLYNSPEQMNRRAMVLYAALSGHKLSDFAVPLVGTYVVFGFNPNSGDSASVPEKLVTALGKKETITDKRSAT